MQRLFVPFLVLTVACGGEPPAPVEAPPAEEPAPEPAKEESAATTEHVGVSVTSIKKGTVEDVHTMQVDASGLSLGSADDFSTLTGTLAVDTTSWSSPIQVRDQRVKDLLLMASDHPRATFAVSSVSGVGALDVGA